MTKLASNVLEKISENNNDYRIKLRDLNSKIDEITSNLVSQIVSSSNYTLDFSKTLSDAKDILINPISRIIESYVIKDLRGVETVNEQFIEKINDKLENTVINTEEEKNNFYNNLDNLLNDKYLEIVKIKRVNFLEDGKNEEVELKINEFLNLVKENSGDANSTDELINSYRTELYTLVENTLASISNLYQTNFINEIENNLNSSVSINDIMPEEENSKEEEAYVPEISAVPEIPTFDNDSKQLEEIPSIDTKDELVSAIEEEIPLPDAQEENSLSEPEENEKEEYTVPTFESEEEPVPEAIIPEIPESEVTTEMNVEPKVPTEVEAKPEEVKKSYNIDEILKIAKSPILDMPERKEEKAKKDDKFINVEPIAVKNETETMESEFNAKEIVEEMLRRLNSRLNEINQRRNKYEEEKEAVDEDEAFVNDLINSSKEKREQLDKFEVELNNKEAELENKQKELDKKINDVMPFANAVLKSEKES